LDDCEWHKNQAPERAAPYCRAPLIRLTSSVIGSAPRLIHWMNCATILMTGTVQGHSSIMASDDNRPLGALEEMPQWWWRRRICVYIFLAIRADRG
jgi:hypothetical protein